MYVPSSVPRGPHYVYVFQDVTRPWFKIGITGDPEGRRKDLCWKVHGARSLRKITEYRLWEFQNYYGAFFVEHAAIGLMKNLGLSPVRAGDWFEIDQATMEIVADTVDRLARSIIGWEHIDGSNECIVHQNDKSPYWQYLRDTKFETLHLRWGADE